MISECLDCSVLFVKEVLAENLLENYQKSRQEFVYENDNQESLDYYYSKIKLEIEKIKPVRGAILDVGCSSGFFLNQMEGWEKHGVEISEKFGAMAKKKIGDAIYIGSFEDYFFQKNYFDVITLQDVFDHFINPRKNLRKCYDMLKPGGLLIIKVHNSSCLYAKITGENFYAIIPPIHLFYFNEKSLRYVLNKIGFKFLKLKFIGYMLQLKTIFYRLSKDGDRLAWYKLYRLFENNIFSKIKIYKNFHDIITIFATKDKKK